MWARGSNNQNLKEIRVLFSEVIATQTEGRWMDDGQTTVKFRFHELCWHSQAELNMGTKLRAVIDLNLSRTPQIQLGTITWFSLQVERKVKVYMSMNVMYNICLIIYQGIFSSNCWICRSLRFYSFNYQSCSDFFMGQPLWGSFALRCGIIIPQW